MKILIDIELQQFTIGTLIKELSPTAEQEMPAFLTSLEIDSLSVWFDTDTKDYNFDCKTKFSIDNVELDLLLRIKHHKGNSKLLYAGTLTIGNQQFTLSFGTNKELLLASYRPDTALEKIDVKQLIAELSPDAAAEMPNLKIDIEEIVFAYQTGESKFMLAFDLGLDLDIAKLPVVGSEFRKYNMGISSFWAVAASKVFSLQEINDINDQLSKSGPALGALAIHKGFTLIATLNIGSDSCQLCLPNPVLNELLSLNSEEDGSSESGNGAGSPAELPAQPLGNTAWFDLNKSLGPVHFERVGVQYKEGELWFLLDATLSAAGLTLSLDGLALGSPLTEFNPKFRLYGLGIDYQDWPLTIGGAFLEQTITENHTHFKEYDGAAVIQMDNFTLSAIGSYAKYKGATSLFIYAVLDEPIGGPAFFFVTGLAAGFGYNRSITMPAISQVATFPLIEQAQSGSASNLTAELDSLHTYIPPSIGEDFLAVGVKFTSFELINSFALLIVSFGHRFELDLLGLSSAVIPTPVEGETTPPLAEMQLALKAAFIPSEGFLGVQAQLTSKSYILSQYCRLTGGFAFFSWFKDDPSTGADGGDFVLTVGGYNPHFHVPPYYPTVPRLGFLWHINDNLSLNGALYFALTNTAIMAGGRLEANWHSGSIKAWFVIGADFLIFWKPHHYDAEIYVDIGASYTFHFFGTHRISIDAGANLHVWGPKFSGTAHIHVSVISLTVSFGATPLHSLAPIPWHTFKSSFLPGTVCSIAVQGGLERTSNDHDGVKRFIVNPSDFKLATNAIVPSKTLNGTPPSPPPPDISLNDDFGIASMGITSSELHSDHHITMQKMDDENTPPTWEDVTSDFVYTPVLKNVPQGLWGAADTSGEVKPVNVNNHNLIKNTLAGVTITPKPELKPDVTHDIQRKKLKYDTSIYHPVFSWASDDSLAESTLTADIATLDQLFGSGATTAKNDGLFTAFDVDIMPTIDSAYGNELLLKRVVEIGV